MEKNSVDDHPVPDVGSSKRHGQGYTTVEITYSEI